MRMNTYKHYPDTTPRSSFRMERGGGGRGGDRDRDPGIPYRKNRHTIEREHHVDRMYRREFPNERRARSS